MEMEKLEEGLKQFYGTEHYYKHLSGFVYTDGVKYLAENAKCYWLLDEILFSGKTEPFQVWKLKKFGTQARLTMQEDSNTPFLINKLIEFTDFPLGEISLWFIDGVLILPSEY